MELVDSISVGCHITGIKKAYTNLSYKYAMSWKRVQVSAKNNCDHIRTSYIHSFRFLSLASFWFLFFIYGHKILIIRLS